MNDDAVPGKRMVAACLAVLVGLVSALWIESRFLETWDPIADLDPSSGTWGNPFLFVSQGWAACRAVDGTASFGTNLLSSGGAILAFTALLALSLGLGDVLCRRLALDDSTRLERFVLSAGLGLIVVVLGMFVLGALQLWDARWIRGVLFVSAVAVGWLERDTIRALARNDGTSRATASRASSVPGDEPRRDRDAVRPGDPRMWVQRGVVSLCAVAVAWLCVLGLVPAGFYDSLIYHLGVPNQWMQNHGIGYLPGHFFSNSPMSHGVVSATLLFIGPDVTPGLVQPCCLAISLVALHAARRRLLPDSWFPVEALVLLASRPLVENAGHAGNDLFVMMYFSLGMLAFVRWRQVLQARWVVVLGLMLGAALSSKYTAAAYIPVFAALVFVTSIRARGLKAALLDTGRLVAAGMLAPLPWLLKNLVATGNPVWPLLTSVFGTREIPERGLMLATRFSASHVRSWQDFLGMPWAASVASEDVSLLIGPAFLMLLPLATFSIPFTRPRTRASLLHAAAALACWIIWCLVFSACRYASPVMAISALLYGLAIGRLLSMLPRSFAVATSLAITAALWSLTSYFLAEGNILHGAAAYHCGEVDAGGYLAGGYAANLPDRPQLMFEAINRLDPEAKVLLLGDNRTFGLKRRHVSATVFDRPLLTRYLDGADDPAELHARLRADGITHIGVNLLEGHRLHRDFDVFDLPDAWLPVWSRFWRKHTSLVGSFPGMLLVEIVDANTRGRQTVPDPITQIVWRVASSAEKR